MALLTPEYLQTKTYSALRDRLVLAHSGANQPGVWDTNDYRVVQRGIGANMSVDVGAGAALVPANDPGNAGQYHIVNDAVINAPISAAHATLPRLDQIVVTVNDTTHGGDATDVPAITVIAGTPSSGATLPNRTGAAALGTGQLRIADVLVPAAAASIVTANIQDRRPWARGIYSRIIRTANAAAGSDYATTSTSLVAIDATNLSIRAEAYTTTILRLSLRGRGNLTAAATASFGFTVDGTAVDGATASGNQGYTNTAASPMEGLFNISWDTVVAAGSHVIVPTWTTTANTLNGFARSNLPLIFTVEEILRPNANNN